MTEDIWGECMKYETLLERAWKENIIVKQKNLRSSKGRISRNKIALSKGLKTNAERACILAEELGHYYTTVGNIIDQSSSNNRRQEHRARSWAYQQMLPIESLIGALKSGCSNLNEAAEFLEVIEDFLAAALEYFDEKYGYCRSGNYILSFRPFRLYVKNEQDSEPV